MHTASEHDEIEGSYDKIVITIVPLALLLMLRTRDNRRQQTRDSFQYSFVLYNII